MNWRNNAHLFLVKNKLIFMLTAFNSLKTFIYLIKSRFDIRYRDNINFERAKTFCQYFNNKEKKNILLQWFNEKDRILLTDLIWRIEHMAFNNIWIYSKIFTKDDEKDRIDYIKYFYTAPIDNYFKNILWNLYNEYYISKSIKELLWLKEYDWRDILDCGAFIGDSAVIFSDTFPKSKIYAFEPNQQNLEWLWKTISHFDKQDIIIPTKFWVSDKTWEIKMDWFGAGSKLDINWEGEVIKLTTIDKFVNENNLNPGIIKMDIEWAEYSAIIWAEETIKQFKPVLFISIYHNGRDFFEIKPLIESWDLWYKFTIHRRNHVFPYSEIILVCY